MVCPEMGCNVAGSVGLTNKETVVSNLEAVRAWQARQVARGECRQCGSRTAAGSHSRCLRCLEHARRYARTQRGIPIIETRRRGRPRIGTPEERRRAMWEQDAWRRPPQQDPAPVRQQRFVRLPGGHYQIVWEYVR